jgi:hypothetical protein
VLVKQDFAKMILKLAYNEINKTNQAEALG